MSDDIPETGEAWFAAAKLRQPEKPPMVISNFDPVTDTIVFSNDRGSWNVSRALRDCEAGKHRRYIIDVRKAYLHNKKAETDKAKVKRFMRMPAILELPLLGVMDEGAMWLIDGQHRLRAMHGLRRKECAAWIIEEADAAPYRIWFNGARLPPFKIV